MIATTDSNTFDVVRNRETMKTAIFFFAYLLLFSKVTIGQTPVKNKVYVSRTLEYLNFLNDSTILTSIGDESDTTNYYIKDGSLFIKHEYWQTGASHKTEHIVKWQDYKIIYHTNDSLLLFNPFKGLSKPSLWEDTLMFVSLPNLKETVRNFKYLKLDYSNPFDGNLKLLIDSLGKVKYERTRGVIIVNNVAKGMKGELTKKEFSNFLDLLGSSLPSKLAGQRGGCGFDAAISNFEIAFNDKIIESKGCSLKWTHAFLFNYLYNISVNPGFVKRERE